MSYLLRHPEVVARLSLEHLALVGTALAIAIVVALPAGIAVSRHRALATPIYGVLGIIYTIPSLALFALLIPALGLGFWTAVVALAAYAQMILVRNTATALAGVDAATVEAAFGMGMTAGQVLWRVQRPLAMPVFLAGGAPRHRLAHRHRDDRGLDQRRRVGNARARRHRTRLPAKGGGRRPGRRRSRPGRGRRPAQTRSPDKTGLMGRRAFP